MFLTIGAVVCCVFCVLLKLFVFFFLFVFLFLSLCSLVLYAHDFSCTSYLWREALCFSKSCQFSLQFCYSSLQFLDHSFIIQFLITTDHMRDGGSSLELRVS